MEYITLSLSANAGAKMFKKLNIKHIPGKIKRFLSLKCVIAKKNKKNMTICKTGGLAALNEEKPDCAKTFTETRIKCSIKEIIFERANDKDGKMKAEK